jgi:hypothetical protein
MTTSNDNTPLLQTSSDMLEHSNLHPLGSAMVSRQTFDPDFGLTILKGVQIEVTGDGYWVGLLSKKEA